MDKIRFKQLKTSATVAQKEISKLTPQQKSQLEESWDIEHAYYSSALEGSKLDREEFNDLAKVAR